MMKNKSNTKKKDSLMWVYQWPSIAIFVPTKKENQPYYIQNKIKTYLSRNEVATLILAIREAIILERNKNCI